MELTIEEWLQILVYPGLTMEEYIDLECAESGADREMDFDIEQEQNNRYELYKEKDNKCIY